MNDPIADMITRIRNANRQKHKNVDIPASKIKIGIARILSEEGYIENYEIVGDGVKKNIRVLLKSNRALHGLKRISKPGLRVYAGCDEIPRVLNGLGTAIVSSNQGLVTDKKARKLKVGGEVLVFVW